MTFYIYIHTNELNIIKRFVQKQGQHAFSFYIQLGVLLLLFFFYLNRLFSIDFQILKFTCVKYEWNTLLIRALFISFLVLFDMFCEIE